MEYADPGKLLVPQAVQRPRLGRRVGVCDHPPAASDADYDLECVQSPLREKRVLTMGRNSRNQIIAQKMGRAHRSRFAGRGVAGTDAGSVRLFVPNQGPDQWYRMVVCVS